MILYLVESTLCLLLFLGFYHLLLANENCYRFNRYYLLGSLGLGMLLPIFHFSWGIFPIEAISTLIPPEVSAFTSTDSPSDLSSKIPFLDNLGWGIYLLGVIIMSVRFFWHLGQLFIKIKQGLIITKENYKLVLLPMDISPFSFFNYCFFSEKEFYAGKLNASLIQHELAHIRQRHSLDILLVEILRVFNWFNPVFHAYKNAIRLNHEYLGDQAALKHHQDIISYQQLLFKYIRAQNAIPLASPLNFSLTKKRFQMIQFHNSEPKNQWKKLLVVPLTFLAFLLFSVSLAGQTKEELPKIREIKIAEETKKKKEIEAIQRSKKIKKRIPTKEELKKWEKDKSFKISLDRKAIKNRDLKKMKPEDFGWYVVVQPKEKDKGTDKYQKKVVLYSQSYYAKNLAERVLIEIEAKKRKEEREAH